MSMNPLIRFVVAALLLTGGAAGFMVPAVSETPATTPPAVTETAPAATELTVEEAIAIALEHAELTKADVTDLKTRRENDDGIPHFDVEFVCGNWEYDYEIHALTGEILEWDKDYEAPKKEKPVVPPATEPAPTEPPATEPPATEPPAQEVTLLTKEEALAIALEHAGLTSEQVTNVRGKLERDDGVPQWELEFRSGENEYDYDIHAETGKILEWDKEYDPPKQETPAEPPATEPPSQEATLLTKEEALAIALEKAGLTAEQVKRVECELDKDDGVSVWEIEFRCGEYEYEFEIHAETGKILEWDKELDD